MAEIKAIPTTYNGVEYRSRLEADMALFLDRLGVPHSYEVRSFLLDKGVHYRPDFALHGGAAYLETRGYESPDGDRQILAFAEAVYGGVLGTATYAAIHVNPFRLVFAQHHAYAKADPWRARSSMFDTGWGFRLCPDCSRWGPAALVRCRCAACGGELVAEGDADFTLDYRAGYLTLALFDATALDFRYVRVRDVDLWQVPAGEGR